MSRDIDVLVADLLAQKVLNAVDFPVSISVPASKAGTGGDELGEAELEISYDEPKVAGDNDVPEISTAFGDFILETARSVRDGSIDLSSEDPDQVKAISVIANSISGGENDKKQLIEDGGDEVRQALEKIITKSAVSVDVEWIKVEAEKPGLRIGNPISLSKMACKVKAKIRACIKVFGRKICVSVTTPKIHLEGRAANLTLSSRGPVTYAQAQFSDLDIVIRIKIWKWHFTIKIGITSLVNKELRKLGPIKLIDLTPLEQAVPFSTKKVTISDLEYSSKDTGLLIGVGMEVK